MPIPFVNLHRQYQNLRGDLLRAIETVLESQELIGGRFVETFEKEASDVFKFRHTVGCSNGTAAITLALRALGIGHGDEVIVPATTFIATAEAVALLGATPVFADIEPQSYGLSPQDAALRITARTKAIIAVHLYGNPARVDELGALARKHNLFLIEDCAQAHLATLNGKPIGSFGEFATFSFYPGKNLGAYGDAGMVASADPELAALVRKLRDHGRSSKYVHDIIGDNCRLDALQAAILSVKLQHLDRWTSRREAVAAQYRELLADLPVQCMRVTPDARCSYHLFVIEHDDRDRIAEGMKALGIATGVHYPLPLHLQPAFAHLGGRQGDAPHAERAAARVLSLPICAELSDEEIRTVAEALREVVV